MAKCAPKKPAKKVAVKDLATKKNPKGGARISKSDLIKLQ
jgi:hypothetical protein